jgi:glycosyltransferase involved in cell wall biosynthesis
MKICYFGDYQITGRTKVLRLALEKKGIEIIDCHSEKKGIAFYSDLWKKVRALQNDFDVLFIGNSGPSNFLPLFAQCVTSKPIVWEPMFSIYDNYVFDRKVAPRWSIKALYYFIMDYVGCRASDVIILDTHANGTYFVETFHADKTKIARVLIGADTGVFYPMEREKEHALFEVEYHGKYIPVQGIDVIVRAAKLLEDDPHIHVTMIGNGQMYKETVKLAETLNVSNITFLPFMPVDELRPYIARADVCFGLIGDVPRVHRAIPNKLYEAAAMQRVTINADTVALREVFTPGEDVIVVPPGNVQAVADAIRSLKASGKALEMGEKAAHTFHEQVSFDCIGDELIAALAKVVPHIEEQ